MPKITEFDRRQELAQLLTASDQLHPDWNEDVGLPVEAILFWKLNSLSFWVLISCIFWLFLTEEPKTWLEQQTWRLKTFARISSKKPHDTIFTRAFVESTDGGQSYRQVSPHSFLSFSSWMCLSFSFKNPFAAKCPHHSGPHARAASHAADYSASWPPALVH